MALIGWMGMDGLEGLAFQVSEEMVLTLSDWKWSGAARYATHKRTGMDALTEFTGREADSISFTVQLTPELGTAPMEVLEKLWQIEREHIPVALTVGEHCYGRYRWNIISHTVTIQLTDAAGKLYLCEVALKLQEYLRK